MIIASGKNIMMKRLVTLPWSIGKSPISLPVVCALPFGMQHPYRQERICDVGPLHIGIDAAHVDFHVPVTRFKDFLGARVLGTVACTRVALLHVVVITLGQVPRHVRHRKRDQLGIIVRFDGVHVRIGHLRRPVDGHAVEFHDSRAVQPVVIRFGVDVVLVGPGANVAAV